MIMKIRTEEFGLVDAQHMTEAKKKGNEREGRMLEILVSVASVCLCLICVRVFCWTESGCTAQD